ncbi:hypothetical protein [Duganella callida]|uniref:Alpha-2-macroglobulin n=1 Tax=Duganella callida TaxID=2561932 RepID=A0A4Y9SXK0_9BURK|nr:hypothetical protein [Duganella callida]TFW29944.1 hypothetical protein E4L98_03025 [Duganella callida]
MNAPRPARPRPLRRCAALLCCGCHAMALSAPPAPAQSASERRNAELHTNLALLSTMIDKASAVCLNNETSKGVAQLQASFKSIASTLSGKLTVERTNQVLRGAREGLPQQVALIENDKIRNCMKPLVQNLFDMVINAAAPESATPAWPEPIDFRFNFKRTVSTDPRLYSENVRLDLTARERPLSRRITMQDAQGLAYYQYDLLYPRAGEIFRGTIIAERLGNSRLSLTAPAITEICFRQPVKLPKLGQITYDIFDCVEGKLCKPSAQSTAWLAACEPKPAVSAANWLDLLVGRAWAQPAPATAPDRPGAPFWHVPSLQTLTKSNPEGVGYTVFSIETDAFRDQNVQALEVDVRVNGIPVLEDGLPPRLRPVPVEAEGNYRYNFALQSLNFQGLRHGCDRIDITLTPSNGRAKPLHATLAYVALRDVAPRTQKIRDKQLTWSASYIVPQKEWRHYAVVHSYSFSASDEADKQRAIAAASRDKQLIDGLQLRYKGQKLVGVIRPPRTINQAGKAAFGMSIGREQEDGQVRFTFTKAEAKSMAQFVVSQRATHAPLNAVIASQPFYFNADGGSRTAAGMCEDHQL